MVIHLCLRIRLFKIEARAVWIVAFSVIPVRLCNLVQSAMCRCSKYSCTLKNPYEFYKGVELVRVHHERRAFPEGKRPALAGKVKV